MRRAQGGFRFTTNALIINMFLGITGLFEAQAAPYPYILYGPETTMVKASAGQAPNFRGNVYDRIVTEL